MNKIFTGSKKAVNFHITEICNMRCKYCFAKYGLKEKTLSLQESLELIDQISSAGCGKLTFVGGEPTLCPWLADMIKHAKSKGLTTMIVSNGTGLSDSFLYEMRGYLDWIGVSINSMNTNSLKNMGQQCEDIAIDANFYHQRVEKINSYGYKLKINTVVTAVNCNEDLSGFINFASPLRWKVLQVLPMFHSAKKFEIPAEKFTAFWQHHRSLVNTNISMVTENVDALIDSYVMIDPLGRFIGNSDGTKYTYSGPILDIGINQAFKQVTVSDEKMHQRGAVYNWSA